eukprot:4416894-Amphidinium_carterae.1
MQPFNSTPYSVRFGLHIAKKGKNGHLFITRLVPTRLRPLILVAWSPLKLWCKNASWDSVRQTYVNAMRSSVLAAMVLATVHVRLYARHSFPEALAAIGRRSNGGGPPKLKLSCCDKHPPGRTVPT